MKTTMVVLKIRDDEDARAWENALGLPHSYRWFETLPANVHVTVLAEMERLDVPIPMPEPA